MNSRNVQISQNKSETVENSESGKTDSEKFLEIRPETINKIEINKSTDKSESNTDEKCGGSKKSPTRIP